MGLLDQMLGALGSGESKGQASGVAEALVAMLNDPRTGGIAGLMQQFQQRGLGDSFASWVGTGQNQPISADDMSRGLGQDRVSELSQRANVPSSQLAALAPIMLPLLIDKLTPNGNVPEQARVGRNSTDILRSLARLIAPSSR